MGNVGVRYIFAVMVKFCTVSYYSSGSTVDLNIYWVQPLGKLPSALLLLSQKRGCWMAGWVATDAVATWGSHVYIAILFSSFHNSFSHQPEGVWLRACPCTPNHSPPHFFQRSFLPPPPPNSTPTPTPAPPHPHFLHRSLRLAFAFNSHPCAFFLPRTFF